MANGLPNDWHIARFDEILTKVDRKFIIDDGQEYDCVGVRWYGNGAFIRERQWGVDIRRKQQWLIKSGDVVYNKLFAWKNAFAIADDTVDGCIVSDKFPTYRIKPELIDSRFLAYYFTTPHIGLQAQNLSKGAAAISKLTLNPPQFWDLTIPLPPLDEQRRIMALIEALAGRIAEAGFVRQEISESLDAFVSSYHIKYSADRTVQLKDILYLDEEREIIDADGVYPQIGIRGFGQGIFERGEVRGTETTYKWFNRLYYGAVVLSQVKGWEGAIGVCGGSFADRFASPEYRTFRCKPGQAIPEYLNELFSSSYFYLKLKDLSRGVGGRRERIRPELFVELEIPMPDVARQKMAVEIFSKLPALRRLQAESQAELDALLPSVLDRAFKGEL